LRDWKGKRYWIVGASEGLGRAVSHELSRRGVELVLSARDEDRLDELAGELPGKAVSLPLDISDSQSVRTAMARLGQVDGLVVLAGVYWPMPAKDWDPAKVEAMCDINFTGTARVVGAALPQMIERDDGHIVLTGSLSGFRGLPGASGYAASKAGVMAMAEALRADLWRTGVEVQLVNPGFIRTRLTEQNDFRMPFIQEPDVAAREFVEHMETDGFSRSFPWLFSSLFRLSQFLPDWLYYRIFT
jgi:NADP-dependent 3-hydroxy acid dehydrogenase YdfG